MGILAVSGRPNWEFPQLQLVYQQQNVVLGTVGHSRHLSTASHPSGAVVLVDGFFFNHQQLSSLWPRPEIDTPASLALAGYEKLGRDFLAQLDGGYSLVLYDPSEERLIFARDHIGQRPLFFHHSPSTCVVGSLLGSINECVATPPKLNSGMLAEFLLQAHHTQAETLFEGVSRVAPGRVYSWQAGRLSDSAIWEPHFPAPVSHPADAAGEQKLFRESAEALTSALLQAAGSPVIPPRRTAVSLSGGLDSSGVAAIAAAKIKPLLLSVLFEEKAAQETAFIELVRGHLSLPFADIQLSQPPDDWVASQLRRSSDFPVEPNGWLTHLVRKSALGHHCDHLLTGYGADELCTGFHALSSGKIRGEGPGSNPLESLSYLLSARGKHSLTGSLLARQLKRLFPRYRWYPTWCTEKFYHDTAIESRLTAMPSEPVGCDPAQSHLWQLLMNPYAQYVRDSEHREAANDGIQLIHPFFSKPVVDILVSLPASLLAMGGQRKALLRQSLAGYLPPTLLSRTDKAEFSFMWSHLLAGYQNNPPHLRNLQQLGWIDVAEIQNQIAQAAIAPLNSSLKQKERIYQLWNILVVEEILELYGK